MLNEVAKILYREWPRHPKRFLKAGGHRMLLSVVMRAARIVVRSPLALAGILFLGVVSLAVTAGLTVALVALARPALAFVSEHGLKGVVGAVEALGETLWHGSQG